MVKYFVEILSYTEMTPVILNVSYNVNNLTDMIYCIKNC